MVKGHSERCKDCKTTVKELLTKLFGEAIRSHNLKLPCRIDDYKSNSYAIELGAIYHELQNQRGYANFVKAKMLYSVDFFIPNPGFIVEFDESQHFSEPRGIALSNYPAKLQLGFDKSKWENLCHTLKKNDNDPPYRDEQRAWYDTLRDFAPSILNLKPTIRLFARDLIWCSLNPDNKSDLAIFTNIFYEYL